MKVTNDIIEILDSKQQCAALFIDLSKAFDTVDHQILLNRLSEIGLSTKAVDWFKNYLSSRTQCVHIDGEISDKLTVNTGVPQGSILGPLLFTIYVNELCEHIDDAKAHLYADDTIIYCSAPTISEAVFKLQKAFNTIQNNLIKLKLVLNVDKTKLMFFSKSNIQCSTMPQITTIQNKVIEVVSSYKYLGFHLDEQLSFKLHIEQLAKRLKLKLGFYFRNKACFSFQAKKQLVAATFLPILDYGDILYMNAPKSHIRALDTIYHAALRFVTNSTSLTHHCVLYELSGQSSLDIKRQSHWYLFVYKAILGQLPTYLSTLLIQPRGGHYNLRSKNYISYHVPTVRTEFGKHAFSYAAPFSWNILQKDLKLDSLIRIDHFKEKIGHLLAMECSCF